MIVVGVGQLIHLEIDRVYVNLLAGLFVNFACAMNFFVYYAVSSEYRRVFDKYLHINSLKRTVGIKVRNSSDLVSIAPSKTVAENAVSSTPLRKEK
ncbi:hypothetical protein RB195_004004 [Necator americanus]|uniref:G-protein coupled receptors family 1 profile domain-containing protein n=1 Tax=Necator americanus TaxID=51031 RepID=A0ABR1DRB7_NECAM